MHEFLVALADLLFEGKIKETYSTDHYEIIVFVVGCSAMAVLIVLLDCVLYIQFTRSALGLVHGRGKTFGHLFLWGVGAGFGGFLAAAGVLELSRASCLTVGIGWPVILPKLIAMHAQSEEVQKSTEEEQG